MLNPIKINNKGIVRFSDFVGQVPPFLREESDVVELLQVMSDYVNNAYRNSQAVNEYKLQIVSSESTYNHDREILEQARNLFMECLDKDVPVLYVTDSVVDPINPLYINTKLKMSTIEDSITIQSSVSTQSLSNISRGDSVIGDGIDSDTYVVSVEGSRVTLSKAATATGDAFLSFLPYNNNFEDVVKFNIYSIDEIQTANVPTDADSGVKYIRQYFNFKVIAIENELSNIDSRYNISSQNSNSEVLRDACLQSSDIRFSDVRTSMVSLSAYTTSVATQLKLDSSDVSVVNIGDVITYDGCPDRTYVTNIVGDTITISQAYPSISGTYQNKIRIDVYSNNAITTTDDTITILPPETIGQYRTRHTVTDDMIQNFLNFDVTVDGGTIEFSPITATYQSGQFVIAGIDLTPYYKPGYPITITMVLTDGSYYRKTFVVDSIAFSTNTTITPVEFNTSITDETIIIPLRISDYVFSNSTLTFEDVEFTVDQVIDYDVNGDVMSESDRTGPYSHSTIVTTDLPVVWFNSSMVDLVTNTLSLNKKLPEQTVVTLSAGENATMPGGISEDTEYYLINNIQDSYQLSLDGVTAETITSAGDDTIIVTIVSSQLNSPDYVQYLYYTNTELNDIVKLRIASTAVDNFYIYEYPSSSPILVQSIISSSIDVDVDLNYRNTNGRFLESDGSGLVNEYYQFLPAANHTLTIDNDAAVSGDIVIINTVVPKYDSVLIGSYTYTYQDSAATTLYEIDSNSYRMYYRIKFVFDGSEWTFDSILPTLHSGTGVFYARSLAAYDIEYPEFEDSYLKITDDTWTGKFVGGRSYSKNSITYVKGGNMYIATRDIVDSSHPTQLSSGWRLLPREIYTELNGIQNPYMTAPFELKAIEQNDTLKSVYSFRVLAYNQVLVSGDVTSIMAVGDSITLDYTMDGNVQELTVSVVESVYDHNTRSTILTVEDTDPIVVAFTTVDTGDDFIEIPYDDTIKYGDIVTFTGASLPSPLLAGVTYYVRSSDVNSVDDTKADLKLSTLFKNYEFIDLTTSGTGTVTIKSYLVEGVSNGTITLDTIQDFTYMSVEDQLKTTIYTEQRNWTINPRDALIADNSRNGWISTTNASITDLTTEFYCRYNLFYDYDLYSQYDNLDGDSKYGWYKYYIRKLDVMSSTDYSQIGVGTEFDTSYIDGIIFNRMTIGDSSRFDLISTDVNSANSTLKYSTDGTTYTTKVHTINETDGYVLIGEELTADSISSGRLVLSYPISIGKQVTVSGSVLPAALSANTIYYVVDVDDSGVALSDSATGTMIYISSAGSEDFYINENLTEVQYTTAATENGSTTIEVDASFDLSTIAPGDYIYSWNSTSHIFPLGTRVKTIYERSSKVVLDTPASQTILADDPVDIQFAPSIDGILYNTDKYMSKISQLEIETKTDGEYAIYSDIDDESIPADIFKLPDDAVLLYDKSFGDSSSELIAYDFSNPYIDAIDTSKEPTSQYDYKRDFNTSILVKDTTGEFIHDDVNIKKSFIGVPDKNYPLVEKIERLIYQKDPNVIDIEFIDNLARLMGYDVTMLKEDLYNSGLVITNEDRERHLRKIVENIPEFNRIKSTEDGLESLLATFGLVGRFVKLWTRKDDPYLSIWLENDSVNSYVRSGRGSSADIVPTPHFKFKVNVEEDQNSISTSADFERINIAIRRNKPINTVFDGIIAYLNATIEQRLYKPGCKNKVKMSASIGYDLDTSTATLDFNECACP